MNDLWEEAWDRLNGALTETASAVRIRNPALWWECGHVETPAFAFSAYASFSKDGTAGDEDVVVSIGFRHVDGTLWYSADLSRGDGEILAERPAVALPMATDTGTIRAWVGDQVTDAMEFVRQQEPLLLRELADQRP